MLYVVNVKFQIVTIANIHTGNEHYWWVAKHYREYVDNVRQIVLYLFDETANNT